MEDVQIEVETEDVEIAKQPEVITGKDQVQVPIDVHMDRQYVRTRTLVRNIRTRDYRKANGLPEFDYVPVQKIPKKKAKYIYDVSDSESPSIIAKKKPVVKTEKNKKVHDKEKVKTSVDKTKEKPKAKETKRKLAKKTNLKSSKTDKGSYLPTTINAYKLLDDETREEIKEYYRKDEIDYFWMQPKKQNMAHELVVLKLDLTSFFIDGAIDSNIIDVLFFIMSKNETKMGQKQNLYLPSLLFNDMEKTNSESDQQHIDRTLKRLLEENVHKVGKVFMLIKHYFHFTLVVWDIKNGNMTHYNSQLPRIEDTTNMCFKHRDKIEAMYKDFKIGLRLIFYSLCKPIESTFHKEELFMRRASIAPILVNHLHSYSNGLKRLLEEKRVTRKFDYIDELFGDDDDVISL
ncbi:hypothetical protein ACFX2I_000479 [Malus domestica]|uniref:Ubiquitin-like protease family profile domain-containing protein n=1 Tax=Malus domestica TaxID=3750 RepID=A0A498KNC2_MALDO|nr:hypothetical protein DVH24_014490 [Malus domestica]